LNDRALSRLLILAAVLAAFAPALAAGFVGWDEPRFILDNPILRGLTLAHLRAMAGCVLGGVWMPLTWLSLAVDYSLWGLEPAGYHLTNLLLHAAAVLLFYEACRRLLPKNPWAPLFAALFFAIHPLRVESVAWAAERKGVLAGALCMAALYARLRSFESPRRRAWEAAALAAFALSLTAKPNGLTFPLALLALEVFYLRRRPSVRDYVPYFVLSAAAFAATLLAMRKAGLPGDVHPPSAAWGSGQALYGLLFYPWKTLWPSGLAAYYPPRPWFGRWSWELAACASGVALAAAALRARRPGAIAAGCYALLLLPTLGLVRHGVLHAAADRFSYLPCLGFAVLFGAALSESPARRALAAVWLAALGTLTWSQCAVWRDPVALWTATARRAPSALADSNLGIFLVQSGRAEEGLALLEKALIHETREPLIYENLGLILQRRGREQDARAVWRRGLAAAPSPELSALLGASLSDATLLQAAVAAVPERAAWRADLGDALATAGHAPQAEVQYAAALALDPDLGRAHNNWGLLLERSGRRPEALEHYRAAVGNANARAQAHHNWGNLLLAENRLRESEPHYREALRLDPRLFQAQVNLGNVLARRGRLAEAAALYRAALKTNPGNIEARANLAAVTGR
jgi:tetratricopeptide (TPR) repeat protein